MRGALFQLVTAVFVSLLCIATESSARQSPSLNSPTPPSADRSTSLRICLRLQGESAFVGPASVRLIPNEGYEVSGTTEENGETLFSEIPPGSYTMEASAPGFLTVRQIIRVQETNRSLSRFVIMKPRPFQAHRPQKPLSTPTADREPGSWPPLGIDDVVPSVDPSAECPLAHVLSGAGRRMEQFVSNLEKFTATERVEHFPVDIMGKQQTPTERKFDYVVMVSRSRTGVFLLDEYRNGSVDPAQFPARIATMGMPAIALLFHPTLTPDYRFDCEGLGEWEGHPAWQVHFVQRPGRPSRILSYSAGGKYSSLGLKGRAWVDPATFQVLRIDTELVEPLKELALTVDHIAISYQPVKFRSQNEELWLPKFAEIYVEREGRRYYRRHAFSDFQLFTVETSQDVHLAKESYGFTNQSDHDVNGVLTVTPVSGARIDPVSLTFTIPAGGSVVKLVGPGKDVGIPVESVGSATFAHDGQRDSVRVDAHLSKDSTLDVISGTSNPLKP